MTTNQPGSWARQDPRNVSNIIRYRFNWNDPGLAAGVQIGILPQNAFIMSQLMEVITTFNGTSPEITVGTVGAAYNNLMATGDITEGTAGIWFPTLTPGAGLIGKLGRSLTQAGDTPVFIKLAVTGAPSQGIAEYCLEFEGGFPG